MACAHSEADHEAFKEPSKWATLPRLGVSMGMEWRNAPCASTLTVPFNDTDEVCACGALPGERCAAGCGDEDQP